MAREPKTKPGTAPVSDYLATIAPETRRAEAWQLAQLFGQATEWQPVLWGPSMIGYGRYRYIYDSGHSGESFVVGFSPRKAEHVIYLSAGFAGLQPQLDRLGKHRLGKSCLYLRSLNSIDLVVLRDLIKSGIRALAHRWDIQPT